MVEKIVIAALISYGYCACFWDKMIFGRIGDWLEERLPDYICNPLFACSICNSFWTASLIYWLYWGSDWKEWIIIAIGSLGFNAIVVNLINKIEDISNPPE